MYRQMDKTSKNKYLPFNDPMKTLHIFISLKYILCTGKNQLPIHSFAPIRITSEKLKIKMEPLLKGNKKISSILIILGI